MACTQNPVNSLEQKPVHIPRVCIKPKHLSHIALSSSHSSASILSSNGDNETVDKPCLAYFCHPTSNCFQTTSPWP